MNAVALVVRSSVLAALVVTTSAGVALAQSPRTTAHSAARERVEPRPTAVARLRAAFIGALRGFRDPGSLGRVQARQTPVETPRSEQLDRAVAHAPRPRPERDIPAVAAAMRTLRRAHASVQRAQAFVGKTPRQVERYLRLAKVTPIRRFGRITGYRLELITHNGFFPVSDHVTISAEGVVQKPLFASSPTAYDGVFGGSWSGISDEALRTLREADATPSHPFHRFRERAAR